MTPVAPDGAGFAAAQQRLRDALGIDVTFHIPTAPTYDPGTGVDPETGEAYDPWAPPVSGGPGADSDVTKRVSWAMRGVIGDDEAQAGAPIGNVASDQAVLILAEADYADVQAATHVTALDTRWKIEEFRPDAMGTHYRRRLVYITRG